MSKPQGPEKFGKTKSGKEVSLYTLDNGQGLSMDVSDYGGAITRLHAPDKHGDLADVVLGYDTLAEYEKLNPYFGVTVGRFANRIANGKFTLDETEYTLPTNETPGGVPAHLHGGEIGLDKVVWDARLEDTPEGPSLLLTYLSPDGDQGYPGNLQLATRYTLTRLGALRVEYFAETDKPTPVNLAQHSYFNLAGHDQGDVLDHRLTLFAERYTPLGPDAIPFGHTESVRSTPLDFRRAKLIGRDIDKPFDQLTHVGGFDHNWVLNKPYGRLRPAARLLHDPSGRILEVWTTLPGIQFYSGNFLDGTIKGKGGAVYPKRAGLCLETQYFPDAPNKPAFPSCILRPGEKYYALTEYRFEIEWRPHSL